MNTERQMRKLEVRMRIAQRRERWRNRLLSTRSDVAASVAREGMAAVEAVADHFPRSQTVRLLLAHPGAALAAAAAVVLVGPARLVRWGLWLLPLLRR